MPYDRGDLVRASVAFTNAAGAAADPTTVVVRVRAPNTGRDGYTTYTYGTDAEVQKTATGAYYLDVACTVAGTYWVRWEGAGAVIAAVEDTWDVALGAFNPP
jgi:hypothetical protein